MGAREATHAYRLRNWAERISQCRNSGMTATAWCESQNINVKSYYYWQRKVRETASQSLAACQQSVNEVAAESKPVFTELALPKTNTAAGTAVIIRFHDAVVEIQNGADFAVVENALRAIKSIC